MSGSDTFDSVTKILGPMAAVADPTAAVPAATQEPREFDAWLLWQERRHCGGCRLPSADGCPVQAAVDAHRVYGVWKFCARCGGRSFGVSKVEGRGDVEHFGNSGAVLMSLPTGRHLTAVRCDCDAAMRTLGGLPAMPAVLMAKCGIQRAKLENNIRAAVLARARQAIAGNAAKVEAVARVLDVQGPEAARDAAKAAQC